MIIIITISIIITITIIIAIIVLIIIVIMSIIVMRSGPMRGLLSLRVRVHDRLAVFWVRTSDSVLARHAASCTSSAAIMDIRAGTSTALCVGAHKTTTLILWT